MQANYNKWVLEVIELKYRGLVQFCVYDNQRLKLFSH